MPAIQDSRNQYFPFPFPPLIPALLDSTTDYTYCRISISNTTLISTNRSTTYLPIYYNSHLLEDYWRYLRLLCSKSFGKQTVDYRMKLSLLIRRTTDRSRYIPKNPQVEVIKRSSKILSPRKVIGSFMIPTTQDTKNRHQIPEY